MLTFEQIEKEATTPIKATTPKKALELSIKHWWENCNLTRDELKGLRNDVIAADMCGLCVFYGYPYKNGSSLYCIESDCKVSPACPAKNSLYAKAEDAISAFIQSHSEENYQSWRKAARAMHKYLCSLRT